MKSKISRDAFLYMEPSSKQEDFAQCSSCALLTPDGYCSILGFAINKPETTSCALYVPGSPLFDDADALVSREEAGYVERSVRCENCKYGDGKRKVCKLYEQLNKNLPAIFDLDTKIDPLGCCNGNTPK